MAGGRQSLRVHADDAGRRIDRLLRALLPDQPLAEIYRLLRTGSVKVDGRKVRQDFRPVEGASVEFAAGLRPVRRSRSTTPASGPQAHAATSAAGPPPPVVYRDEHLLVVDKPSGVPTQPGAAGTRDGDDHLLARCAPLLPAPRGGGALAFRPAPAHRIDRGTSGLVVVGISGPGLRGMVEAFRDRNVAKIYRAVVRPVDAAARGLLERGDGRVELALTAGPARGGGRIARVAADGKSARTDWRVVGRRADGAVVVEAELVGSGRTHQIRAHLAAVGLPLVGDRKYGGEPAARLMLHAWRLRFAHPVPGGDAAELDLCAAAPPEFVAEAGETP